MEESLQNPFPQQKRSNSRILLAISSRACARLAGYGTHASTHLSSIASKRAQAGPCGSGTRGSGDPSLPPRPLSSGDAPGRGLFRPPLGFGVMPRPTCAGAPIPADSCIVGEDNAVAGESRASSKACRRTRRESTAFASRDRSLLDHPLSLLPLLRLPRGQHRRNRECILIFRSGYW